MQIRDPGWKKSESRIWDKHPGSATMLTTVLIFRICPRCSLCMTSMRTLFSGTSAIPSIMTRCLGPSGRVPTSHDKIYDVKRKRVKVMGSRIFYSSYGLIGWDPCFWPYLGDLFSSVDTRFATYFITVTITDSEVKIPVPVLRRAEHSGFFFLTVWYLVRDIPNWLNESKLTVSSLICSP